MGDNPCTVDALRKAFTSVLPPAQAVPNPVLQVLQIKPIAAQANAPERFRVVLSDSTHFIQAMISTQTNHVVQSGELQKGCFIKLTNYNAQKVKDKKILIIIELEVLKAHGVREKVGNPTALEAATAGQTSAPAAYQTSETPAFQEPAAAPSFYGNKPAPQRNSPIPAAASRAASGGDGGAARSNIYPIEAISPYQNKWTIKARVTNKSDIKSWSNSKSEGRLFTVTFLDESGEIRATAFNQECDAHYEVLQEGQVYFISKCRVVMAKKQFSNVNNDYELTFGRETEIEVCNDDDVPKVNFNFVPLSELERVEKDAFVDVLGVVKEVGDMEEITSKATQKPYSKREISLVDSSNTCVRCTVWGKNAETFDIAPDTVIAFKGVKVSDFGGRSLSMLYSSSMMANPDVDEAHNLKGWYDGQGQRDLSTYQTHAGLSTVGAATGRNDPYKTLLQVKEENIGMNGQDGKPEYFTTKATIVYIKHDNISYPACLKPECNKKVIPRDDDSWGCEKCGVTHPRPQYRYIMTISVNDAFGQAWLNCFDEIGRLIMGKSADEMHELKERSEQSGDEKEYEACFAEAICKTFVFRCRAKEDTFQENSRIRYQVMSATPVNYAQEAAKMVEQINLYGA
ncbi:hypothetical protein BZA05DRAFT_345568 [Tricharina praecox]|uniref:uncharacterized protein n=1 Tax=Tricharina praecox TaxID=43433 RepID=UPI00221E782B|nr:uncharacterized protein BZA05DRAFT_345568 [Tricharina praecox]KAI5858442.1 hypothetical protein BZA05DRAFT_345568 [Tricharina praecox]